MPIPVIDTTTSIQAFRKGEFFTFQPGATESPTSWSATGLPAGVTINTTTGKISGAATEAGVYIVPLVAVNGAGSSLTLMLVIAIENTSFSIDSSVDLDFDLATGKVTNPGMAADSPFVLYGKTGDRILCSVGFKRSKWLQQIPLEEVKLGLKEYEPEGLVSMSDGNFVQIGSYDTARFQFIIHLDPDKLKPVLSGYERAAQGDDTYLDCNGELRYTLLYAAPGSVTAESLERTSQTFKVRVARDMVP